MKTSNFDYELPQEFIAQSPIEPRDASKLLILNHRNGKIQQRIFRNIKEFLLPGDLLVINTTRVIPARIFAHKQTGGKVEILLLRKTNDLDWMVILGGKRLKKGMILKIDNGPQAEIIELMDGPNRIVRFSEEIEKYFPIIGNVPLPPYIHRKLDNPERYQTIYNKISGSAAAPTAGLHFTENLMKNLKRSEIQFAEVILHVGLDTFAPVNEEIVEEHQIHKEWCQVSKETAHLINQTKIKGGRVIAVGTTSVRTIESAARNAVGDNCVGAFEDMTDLFILPGYKFKIVDAIITNFHLPKTTLIMLVSAFAGWQNIKNAYEVAKEENYRFYSFGDAMFIN